MSERVVKRRIVVERDIDRNLCIDKNELMVLFDYWRPAHPLRLGFMIMATCGLRPSEICGGYDKVTQEIKGLTVKAILNDFKYLKYTVRKPTNKFYPSTGTLVTTYKKRTVEIKYSTLRHELKLYCMRNYHTFKDGKLFSYPEDAFRKALMKIREKVKGGLLNGSIWHGFIDKATQNIYCPNDTFKQQFRITPYSCRRFYNTFKLWCEYGGDIVLSTKDLGHTHIDTNLIYTYSPDKIGIPKEDLKRIKNFDSLFNSQFKGQLLLNEF